MLWIALALSLVGGPSVRAAVPEAPDGPYAEAYLSGRYAEALTTLEGAGGTTIQELPLNWATDRAELLYILGRSEEALLAMRDVVQAIQEPWYTIRMVEMLREMGRDTDAEQGIQWAMQQSQYNRRPQFPRRNLLAMGRIARIRGENPNRVLQIYQQRILSPYPDFVDGYVEAGELALASYGYDLAEEYFLAALKLESEHQGALSGLADTYFQAGDPRFEAVRAQLEGLNAHHPRLLCIVLAQTLSAGDVDASEHILTDLLRINPYHRQGLAGRAALAFLQDDPAAQDEALSQLAQLNPTRGDGYLTVAEVAARRYRFTEAVALLRTAADIEPDNGEIQTALGLNLLRTGSDDEGRRVLEAAFVKDKFNVQLYNMLEVLDTVSGFATITTPSFEIRLPEPESAVMGREIEALLDEALTRYEQAYDVRVTRPVHIQIFDEHDEFMVRSVGLPGNPGHLGICFGGLVTLDSPRARPPRSMNWRSVLWHEFVHVITLQKTNNRIPRWLSEGISVYEEVQRDPAWGQPVQPEFGELLDDAAWPGVGELEAYFIRPESPDHLMLGYFLAGEFVTSYVETFGQAALVAALAQMGDGADVAAALTGAAGQDMSVIDQGFGRHLSRVCKPLRYLKAKALPAVFIPKIVTPSFPDALRDAREKEEAGDLPGAIDGYEGAATLYPDYPGDENPLRRLAAIHQASGDTAAWASAVARLCRNDSTAWDEPYAYGMAAAARGDWEEVLTYMDWCAAIDPFDSSLFEARLRAQENLGHREGALETLARLSALDSDKAEEYKLASARILIDLARRDEARRIVLEVLEAFPEYREAQLVLLALHDGATEVPDAS